MKDGDVVANKDMGHDAGAVDADVGNQSVDVNSDGSTGGGDGLDQGNDVNEFRK